MQTSMISAVAPLLIVGGLAAYLWLLPSFRKEVKRLAQVARDRRLPKQGTAQDQPAAAGPEAAPAQTAGSAMDPEKDNFDYSVFDGL